MGQMGIASSLSARKNMGTGRCFLLLWVYRGYLAHDFDTKKVVYLIFAMDLY